MKTRGNVLIIKANIITQPTKRQFGNEKKKSDEKLSTSRVVITTKEANSDGFAQKWNIYPLLHPSGKQYST